MIQKILHKKKLIALIVKSKKIKKIGPHFVTPTNFTQQLGIINYPKNHFITPHTHKKHLHAPARTHTTRAAGHTEKTPSRRKNPSRTESMQISFPCD